LRSNSVCGMPRSSGAEEEWGALQLAAERLGEQADKEEEGVPLHGDVSAREGKEEEEEGKAGEEGKREPSEDVSPPVKKAAGWGEETEAPEGKVGERRRRSSAAQDEVSDADEIDERGKSQVSERQRRHFAVDDEGEEDIMVIPDLDEDHEEDLQNQVADAPANFRSVQSMRELDSQIKGLELLSSNGVDLSILTSVLVPRDKLEELDEAWEPESLLEQVSQKMRKEKEERNKLTELRDPTQTENEN